jgi:hypothetical protein
MIKRNEIKDQIPRILNICFDGTCSHNNFLLLFFLLKGGVKEGEAYM